MVTNYRIPESTTLRHHRRTRRCPVVHQLNGGELDRADHHRGSGHQLHRPGIGRPDGITAGSDGALWFTNTTAGNALHRADHHPGGGHQLHRIRDQTSRGIAAGPDGALWFTNLARNTGANHRVNHHHRGGHRGHRSEHLGIPAASPPAPTEPCGSPTMATAPSGGSRRELPSYAVTPSVEPTFFHEGTSIDFEDVACAESGVAVRRHCGGYQSPTEDPPGKRLTESVTPVEPKVLKPTTVPFGMTVPPPMLLALA